MFIRHYDVNGVTNIWRKSDRSQITLSAEGISYNIARQVKLTPDAFGSLQQVRRILQVAAFEKCPQARKKIEYYYTIMTCVNINSTFNISGPHGQIILYKFEGYLVCLGRTHGDPYRGYGYVPLRGWGRGERR